MASTTLDQAIDKILENYEGALIAAMQHASEKAKDDIEIKAKSCLANYYGSYSPSIYGRTNRLESSFIPYLEIEQAGGHIRSSVGMGYWAFMLDGAYSGSRNWTPVDGSWVLDNYLKGIHPRTDGSTYPGAPYIPVSSESPDSIMKEYLEKYVNKFDANVWKSFLSQISSV